MGFHDRWLARLDWAETSPVPAQAVWLHIELNHRCNCALWKEEDQARRRNVPDAEIAANKRTIDAFNPKRNDSIEKIDEYLPPAKAGGAQSRRQAAFGDGRSDD